MSRSVPVPVAALIAASAAAADERQATCPIGVPPQESFGATFPSDRIEVPENRSEPDGGTIDLAHVVLKSNGLAPFADPVIQSPILSPGTDPNGDCVAKLRPRSVLRQDVLPN